MSIYPVAITRESGRQSRAASGGKDFHLVLVELADGRALFITRFARKGQWGTLRVEKYEDGGAAQRAYDAKRQQKLEGEYSEPLEPLSARAKRVAENAAEFQSLLGPQYWYGIGADMIHWMDPTLPVKGVRSPKDSVSVTSSFRRAAEADIGRLPPAKIDETQDDRAKADPLWGAY